MASARRINNILLREWEAIFRDLNSALFVTCLPVLILAQAMVVVWLLAHYGGEAVATSSVFMTAIARMAGAMPSTDGLHNVDMLRLLLLNQLPLYLLLVPAIVAVAFATFSILEEKLTQSLEPILATPVRTWELLLGKALSGAVPAIAATWVCAGLLVAGLHVLQWDHLLGWVMTASWYLALFLLTPAVALLSFLLGIIASPRAADSKAAQNIAILIILPVMALIGIQVTGQVWFTPILMLAISLAVIVIDIMALFLAVRLFRRETIVSGWR